MQKRIPWDQYFMLQAILLSLRSTCNRLHVGAVLTKENQIIGEGYNGSVSGDEHCIDSGCYIQDGHCVRTVHAEVNAISQCAKLNISTDDSSIYITDFPCLACTKMLLQAGIKKIYYLRNYNNDPYVEHLFKLKNIEIKQIEIDKEYLKENFLSELF